MKLLMNVLRLFCILYMVVWVMFCIYFIGWMMINSPTDTLADTTETGRSLFRMLLYLSAGGLVVMVIAFESSDTSPRNRHLTPPKTDL